MQVKIKLLPNPTQVGAPNQAMLTVEDPSGIQTMGEAMLDTDNLDTTVEVPPGGKLILEGLGIPGEVDYKQSASVPADVAGSEKHKDTRTSPNPVTARAAGGAFQAGQEAKQADQQDQQGHQSQDEKDPATQRREEEERRAKADEKTRFEQISKERQQQEQNKKTEPKK